MFRIAMSFCMLVVMSLSASAQWFPNAPWNKTKQASVEQFFAESECVNGQCARNTPVLNTVRNVVAAPLQMVEAVVSVPRANYVQQYQSNYGPAPTGNSGGSCGSLVVGRLDPRGHIITSVSVPVLVAPTLAPDLPQEVSVLRIGDRMKFKRSLLAAAKQAVANEKITQDQFDALEFALKFPGVAGKIEAALKETAVEKGLATTQAIDWDQLADFIERMIPIILKLIDLFSWNSNSPQLETQYAYQPIYDYQLAA